VVEVWLTISDPKKNFYAKNHMIATLIFARGETIDNVEYNSARISMELPDEKDGKKVTAIVGQEVRTHTPT
jgi:hypothetical protein